MLYVFDTSSFIVTGHYFPERFPSFWERFNEGVEDEILISCREVLKELDGKGNKKHLDDWLKGNRRIFLPPNDDEAKFVGEIFTVPHFQHLVSEQQRLKGVPVADPFVIASAKVRSGCVVTEEAYKKGAARIPNVCKHFGIECTNLDGFMKKNKWQF